MSALTSVEIPKEVVAFWRKTLGDSKGQFGIDWLRRNGPKPGGATAEEVVRNAYKFTGWQEALDAVEDQLTAIPVQQKSLDEPLLETPDPR